MPFNLDRLKEILHDLAARLDLQPTYGWAVVTSVAPLQIRYDAQSEPIAGTPDTLVSGVAVGDRVWCMRIFRRDLILGRAKGSARTGTLSVPSGPLSQVGTTQIWASGITITVPTVAPPGTVLRVSALGIGTGYGQIVQVASTPGLTSTNVSMRFTQVGNSIPQPAITLLWELVPITN